MILYIRTISLRVIGYGCEASGQSAKDKIAKKIDEMAFAGEHLDEFIDPMMRGKC